MTLSTQLTRGALAMPMLLAFAGLGVVASQQSAFEQTAFEQTELHQTELHRGRIVQVVDMRALSELAAVAEADHVVAMARAAEAASEHLSRLCAASARSRTLVLAQAPADLGNLAIRWGQACRA